MVLVWLIRRYGYLRLCDSMWDFSPPIFWASRERCYSAGSSRFVATGMAMAMLVNIYADGLMDACDETLFMYAPLYGMKRKWADMTWMKATRYYLPIGSKEYGGRGEACEINGMAKAWKRKEEFIIRFVIVRIGYFILLDIFACVFVSVSGVKFMRYCMWMEWCGMKWEGGIGRNGEDGMRWDGSQRIKFGEGNPEAGSLELEPREAS